MGNEYGTKEAADWLNVTTAAVRRWTIHELKPFMSPTAQGGDGQRRTFTDQDLQVMAYLKGERDRGRLTDDILADLEAMQADDWQGLPAVAMPSPGNVLPMAQVEQAIAQRENFFLREIGQRDDRIGDLETELKQERVDHDHTRQELGDVRQQLGVFEGKLAQVETSHGRERAIYARLVIAVGIAAALLLLAVIVLALLSAGVG